MNTSASLSTFLLSAALCLGQESVAHSAIQPDQKLGANDLIKVSVYNAPELSGDVRVGSDGTLRLPLLKLPLDAKDKLPNEIEKLLSNALKEEELFLNPLVRVTVIEYQSRTVTVSGAVRRPTTFQALGGITLLDALAKADGLSPEAGQEVLVTRRESSLNDPNGKDVRRIPIQALFQGGDPALNIILSGGEQIRIPEAGRIYVVGNVKKQGAISLAGSPNPTVLKVLAQAEGLTPYAQQNAFIYRSEPGRDGKREIAVNLKTILKGGEQNLLLQADDILYVPDNNGKRMTMQAIDRILGFSASTISGVLVWRTAR